jgi:deazaflavin-dependent oxidoreductase (nitroreductase family)
MRAMTTAAEWNAFNDGVIDEFRTRGGRVGGRFEGRPMILVNHVGARSGKQYTTPLVYSRDGDRFVVIASKGGAPEHPSWYHNLVANPDVTVEVGTETIPVRARVAEGEERERLYRAQAEEMPNFDAYAARTSRQIPVIVFERQ